MLQCGSSNSDSFDFFSLWLMPITIVTSIHPTSCCWRRTSAKPAWVGKGDFNYDGVVNALDFNILATNFGNTLAPPSAPVPDAPIVALSATLRKFVQRSIR